jgi:hypothetical protein
VMVCAALAVLPFIRKPSEAAMPTLSPAIA